MFRTKQARCCVNILCWRCIAKLRAQQETCLLVVRTQNRAAKHRKSSQTDVNIQATNIRVAKSFRVMLRSVAAKLHSKAVIVEGQREYAERTALRRHPTSLNASMDVKRLWKVSTRRPTETRANRLTAKRPSTEKLRQKGCINQFELVLCAFKCENLSYV